MEAKAQQSRMRDKNVFLYKCFSIQLRSTVIHSCDEKAMLVGLMFIDPSNIDPSNELARSVGCENVPEFLAIFLVLYIFSIFIYIFNRLSSINAKIVSKSNDK